MVKNCWNGLFIIRGVNEMKQLVNLDNCLSDFFQGHKNLVLVASYDKNTTIEDVLNQLEQDINNQDVDSEYAMKSLIRHYQIAVESVSKDLNYHICLIVISPFQKRMIILLMR